MSDQNCKHYESANFNNGEKSGTVCLECGRIEIQAVKLPEPYPDHIYLAAQRAIENGGTGYDVLHKVWEASTVNTLVDLRNLPDNTVVITAEPINRKIITRVYEKTDDMWHTGDHLIFSHEIELPATVIYWGE
jgi:hypothetical protein